MKIFRFRAMPMCAAAGLAVSAGLALAAPQKAADEVTPQVQRLYEEARAARQHGDEAGAIAKYQELLKLAPHLAVAYNNLGMLYFDRHEYAEAAKALEHALSLNHDLPTASAMLGMSYFQLGEDQKAVPQLEAALRGNPKDDQVAMVLSQVLINEHELEKAAVHLRAYVERNPRSQEALYLLGKTYLQLSQETLGRIDQIDPDSVVAHEIAGEVDMSMHNYDQALVEYAKAVARAPHQPGTHMHLGDAYWNIGKWQSAGQEFRAELENDSNSCMAHWKLANAILEANDEPADALTHAQAAVERCPQLMQAHVDRARALVRLGRHAEALPDLELALKESPKEPSIHFLLAQVYRSTGKPELAHQEMRTYSDLQRQQAESVANQAKAVGQIKDAAK